MLFTPRHTSRMWDTWLYYHEGTHYLFYLHNSLPDVRWDGISLATSRDGVHFEDRGPIVEKAPDATWLGTGMTWHVPGKDGTPGRFLLNFSEERNEIQEIFFAESTDLLSWRRLPAEESICLADPRWYAGASEWSPQRWDCIWVTPREDGPGYTGFLTAVAADGPPGLRGTCGVVVSEDGVRFQAAPPAIVPGEWGDHVEVGAVEKIGDRWYLLLGMSRMQLGARHVSRHPTGETGMYVLESERQLGPYRLGANPRVFLGGSPRLFTYFARFYRCGDSLLLNHHTVPRRRTEPVTFAPLKAIHRADGGALSLHWWPGNEPLRGAALPVSLQDVRRRGPSAPATDVDAGSLRLDAAGSGLAVLPARYDTARGLILEASLTWHSARGPLGGMGLFIGGPPREMGSVGSAASDTEDKRVNPNGTMLLAQTDGQLATGTYDGAAFRVEDVRPLSVPAQQPGQLEHWRLLLRDTYLELYMDDALILCFALAHPPDGRLGFVVEAGSATAKDVRIWEMTL